MHSHPPIIPFEVEELSGTINDRFEKVRRLLPAGQIAYHDPCTELTYEQLFEVCDRLAAALAAALGPDLQKEQQLVALYLDADWTEIAAFVGVIAAGHYYVPFDPRQGQAHPESAFAEYPIRALITVKRHADVARQLAQLAAQPVAVLFLDDLPEAPAEYARPVLTLDSYHSVYLTTGSTGKPRGVLRSHGMRMHVAYLTSVDLGFGPGDRITLTMPVSLGMSLIASLTGLMNGVSLHRRLEALSNPAAFYRWLAEEDITIVHGAAGLIRSLASLPEEFGPLKTLRHIDTGGEAISRKDIDRLLRFMPPGGKFNSRLASNEASSFAMFRVQAGDVWEGETNPVGFIPRLVEVSVVDENRQPLPAGQAGELVVRSRYMALGYYNDPVQTAARFEVARDGSGDRLYYTGDMGRVYPDGRVEFIGRKDFRVKVRGYTIELEAVEKALCRLEHVRGAAVTVQVLPGGNKRLVGFLEMENGRQFSAAQAREQLTLDLPQYMIPPVLQVVDSLPRIGIGKIDRKALPVPAPQRSLLGAAYRAPENELQAGLARIWETVLGIQPVGVDDNFFELGGDSLLSMQMILEVEQQFSGLSLEQFLKLPTIANLEKSIQSQAEARGPAASAVDDPEQGADWARAGKRGKANRLARLTPGRILSGAARRVRTMFEGNMLSRPYADGLAWLLDWSSRPVNQNLLYSPEKTTFKNFWLDLHHEMTGFEEPFARALTGNIFADHLPVGTQRQKEQGELTRFRESPHLFWRSFAQIMEQPESSLAGKYLAFAGEENLQTAFKQGQGVLILSYHGTLTRLPSLFLSRWLGKPAALVLSPRVSMREDSGSDQPLKRQFASLQRIQQAQYSSDIMMQGYRALQNREAVMAFVDNGYPSRGEWPLDVCGRRYMTRTGWADLALRTGSPVVPMLVSMSPEGQSTIRFLPAFTLPAGQADQETRLQATMSQFAGFLSSVFSEHPDSLRWKLMRNHLEMALAGAPESKPA